ncbi:FIG domain-containing protein [Streptomyces bottropensis]|uniref:Uncharacterized protein n=1 Tax=Streptomyces bottropensis TaxID=42235 RepID=A0ABU8AKG8_9ACTN
MAMSNSLAFDIVYEISEAVRPILSDPGKVEDLSGVVEDKGDGHTAHRIDLYAEKILFDVLDRIQYKGTVYSEERGLVKLGNDTRLLVCDPYCNTSLTFRGFRECAVAAYEYSLAGDFVSGAIADLQINRALRAEAENSTRVVYPPKLGTTEAARCSEVRDVEDAFLAISLLKHKRRALLPLSVFQKAALVTTIDGAITAARISLGEIDGFIDASVGQPSYEALAYEMVRRAGGVVSDTEGNSIDFRQIAADLAKGVVRRHPMVVSSNAYLHQEMLSLVQQR